jgi:DNA mismatch repair protein MutS2
MAMIIAPRTLDYLGWKRIEKRLSHHLRTPFNREQPAALEFLPDAAAVSDQMSRIGELKDLIAAGESPEFSGVTDIRELCRRASKEGTLDAMELLQVGDCLHGLSRLRGYLSSHSHQLQSNRHLASRMHDLRTLSSQISASLDRDGRIKDSASASLRDLRTRASAIHQSIRERLEDFLKSRKAEEMVQDKYFTLREDRYVLPIRIERKGNLEGIVHGVSQTGQTVFIEPQFLISANNRLKLMQEEVRREEFLVLQELTDGLAELREQVVESLAAAADLDRVCARALLALEMKAHAPQIDPESRLELRRCRSPHLLLAGQEVIPNDIVLGGDNSWMVLSGPNAGGKSVALKTCGLCLLMARAGLHIPASADSQIPILQGLHALPGDLEDVDANLSTFSGHLQALNQALASAGPGHLVLIDEITVGTEPDQGSALGAAFLTSLADTGTMGIVATHYERLKALAMGDSRFANGAMGMDWKSLAPTYTLVIGSPGSSRTFEIARRFEVPEAVIHQSQEILQGRGGGMLEEALKKLDEKARNLEEATRVEQEKSLAADQLMRRRVLAMEQLKKHADRITARKVNESMKDVEEALMLVSFLVAQLQTGKPDHKDLDMKRRTLKEVKARLEKKAQELTDDEAARELAPGPPVDLTVGCDVLVKKYRKKATVVQLHDKDQTATLQMGPLRLRLSYKEIVPMAAEPKKEPTRRLEAAVPGIKEHRVDLRGLSAEEALNKMEKALDQAMFTAGALLTIVHGHGTGRLKVAVRKYLKSCAYPLEFKPGKREEGGDGVTMIEFK